MPSSKISSALLSVRPWVPAGVSLFILSLVLASFWVRPLLELELASLSNDFLNSPDSVLVWITSVRLMALVSVALGLFWSLVARMKTRPSTESGFILLVALVIGPALASSISADLSPSFSAIYQSRTAVVKIQAAESSLGRSTPMGQQLRMAVSSLDALMENQDLVDTIANSSNDPEEVMEVIGFSPVLGLDHPVIEFAVNNGLVAHDAREVLYRDFVESVRQNPELAKTPGAAEMLARLASR